MYFSFFNDTATTEIYTLSLHDALPISSRMVACRASASTIVPDTNATPTTMAIDDSTRRRKDRKSTRLNSSHSSISYAVFCLKKKKKNKNEPTYEPITYLISHTYH